MPLTSIVYPAPPPTNNTLDPEQRTRLLRSTRKLEAVLGATPHLVDPEGDGDSDAVLFPPPPSAKHRSAHPRSHLTPNHHTRRLNIYTSPSASSSASSIESTAEQDYVFVKGGPGAHSAPYQVVPVPLHSRSSSTSPGSSRSASPANSLHREVSILGKKNANANAQGQGLVSGMPMTVAVDIPLSAEKKKKAKAKAGPQALAQPMLLRLRALPIDSRHTHTHTPSSSMSSTFSSNSATSSTPLRTARPAIPTFPSQDSLTLNTHTHTQPSHSSSSSSKRQGKIDSVLGPLSPLIASLTLAGDDGPPRSPTTPTNAHAHHSRSVSMSMTTTTPSRTPVLSDKDRRRKMAKLQRTLGENIPLELVFGVSAPASAGAAPTTTMRPEKQATRMIRRTSLSAVPFFVGANPNANSNLDVSTGSAPAHPSSQYHRTSPHKSSKSLFEGGVGVGSTLAVAQVPLPPLVPAPSVPALVPSAPSLAHAPLPASDNAHTSTSTSQSTPKHRKPRPRSLTLGTSSAFVRANQKIAQSQGAMGTGTATGSGTGTTTGMGTGVGTGTGMGRPGGSTSLDSGSRPLGSGVPFGRLERTQQPLTKEQGQRGLGLLTPFDTIGLGVKKERREKKEDKERKGRKSSEDKRLGPDAREREHEQEWEGRRKEKEWSGEWNVRDMEVVARQLRNLKV